MLPHQDSGLDTTIGLKNSEDLKAYSSSYLLFDSYEYGDIPNTLHKSVRHYVR
jgi:hypothetical protein